jgi:hypothetical protein
MALSLTDNHAGRRYVIDVRRMSRRILVCRWQQTATGALEYIWHTELLTSHATGGYR